MSGDVMHARMLLEFVEKSGFTPEDLLALRDHGAGGVTFADFIPKAILLGGAAAREYQSYWEYLAQGDPEPACICTCERCRDARRLVPNARHCDGSNCAVTFAGIGSRPLWAVKPTDITTAALVRKAKAEINSAHRAKKTRARGMPARQSDGSGAYSRVVSAAKSLYKLAMQDRVIATNPLRDLSPQRKHNHTPRGLTPEQLEELWDVVCSGGDDVELDALIVWTMLELGCRRGGILRLRCCDLLPATGKIRLREKGDKERLQPASAELIAALHAHALERGATGTDPDGSPVIDPNAPVLYYRRRPWRRGHERFRGGEVVDLPHPISKKRFEILWRRLRKQLPWAAEIGLRPHDLRKTVGTLVERLAGHAIARAYLGHGPADTTGIYTAATADEVEQAHRLLTGAD